MNVAKTFRDIEFWAENGAVYVVHKGRAEKAAADGEVADWFRGIPPKVFLRRAIAAACLEYNQNLNYPSELRKIKQFIADAKEVYDKAVEQGAYDDPKVDIWKEKHRPYNKTRIIVPRQFDFLKKSSKEILLNGLEDE